MKSPTLNLASVAVADYQVVTANIARAIITQSNVSDAGQLHQLIGKKLNHLGRSIAASFVPLDDSGNTLMGFVVRNVQVKPVTQKELTASYQVMAKSNICMDTKDNTLWDIKRGPAGVMLSRHNAGDVGTALAAAVTPNVTNMRISTVASVQPAPRQFVAFVTPQGQIDHGFVTSVNRREGKAEVVSASTKKAVIINNMMVVTAAEVEVPAQIHRAVTAATGVADYTAKDVKIGDIRDYYKHVYSYDQDYLNLVMKNIDDMALA